MKKLLGIIVVGLLLSTYAYSAHGPLGMSDKMIKPLIIIGVVCSVIIGSILFYTHNLNKNSSLNFWEGLTFIAGPGLLLIISSIILFFVVFCLWFFYFKYVLIFLGIIFGLGFILVFMENAKKNR